MFRYVSSEDFKKVGLEKNFPLKTGHVVKLTNDRVFRIFIKNKRNRRFLAKIINIVTKIDYYYLLDNMILIDTNMPEDNMYSHYNDQDVLVYIDKLTINLEMSSNKYFNKRKNERTAFKYAGNQYKVGEKYEDDVYIFYQICIEDYSLFNNDLLITESKIVEVSTGNYESELEEFRKFHVNLKNIDKLCYNDEGKYFKFLTLDKISDLEQLSQGDDILMDSLKSLKNISTDSILISELEKQELEEYCIRIAQEEKFDEGKAIGISERNIEIARNLLEQNIDINIICKSTGLDLKEIEKLKDEINL